MLYGRSHQGSIAKRNSVYFQPRGLSPDLFRMDIQLFHVPWTLGQLITFSEPQFPQKQAELKGSHLWKDIIWHFTPNNYMHITLYFFFVLFFLNFFKRFFLMWTIFKVSIEFITILPLLFMFWFLFWPGSMCDLSFPTRNCTPTLFIGRWSLNRWTTREVSLFLFFFFFHLFLLVGG